MSRVRQANVGEIIALPAQVTAAMRSLDADYSCLDVSIKTAAGVDTAFLQSWDQKLIAWKTFFSDNSNEATMLFKGTGQLLRQVAAYRIELGAWDKLFTERFPDAVHACPAPAPPGAGSSSSGFEWPWWGTSLLTLGAVGGVYLGYRYITAQAELAGKIAGLGRDVERADLRRRIHGIPSRR